MSHMGRWMLQGVIVLAILAFSALSLLARDSSPLKVYVLGLAAAGVAAVALSEVGWQASKGGAGAGSMAAPELRERERSRARALSVESSMASPELHQRQREFNKLANDASTLLRKQADETALFAKTLGHSNAELRQLNGDPRIDAIILNLTRENANLSKKLKETTLSLEQSRVRIEQLCSDLSTAEQAALQDSLTQVGNRRSFDAALARAVAQAKESGAELCVGLGDVDNFKRINDNFGHLIGDGVLKLIAELFVRNAKGRGHVARFGGEEFAIIFPETRLADAMNAVEQIRRQVEAKQWTILDSGKRIGSVTISFGIAGLQEGESPEELMSRVDSMLHEAKAAGKNRVTADAAANESIALKKVVSGA